MYPARLGNYAVRGHFHPKMGESVTAMVDASGIELTAGGSSLKLTTGERGWTSMTLGSDEAERELGAENIRYLIDRLRSFLEQPSDKTKWVLTLSETHVTAYGNVMANGLLLRFQNSDAKFLADLPISQEERRQWLSALNQWVSTQ